MEEYKSNSDAFIFLDPPYLNWMPCIQPIKILLISMITSIIIWQTVKSKVMLIVKGDKYITNLFENI